MAATHVPVLLQEAVARLAPKSGGLYIDATLGVGGHSRAILEASAPDGRVIGFEWDGEAAARAKENLAGYGGRMTIVNASYARMAEELERLGEHGADGILADLGLSSLQLGSPERGFSFQHDAPLDMRMDLRRETSAARLLAELSEAQLADLIYHYGEERQARRIARHLAEARAKEPIRTTGELAALVARAVPRRFHPEKTHVATRTFQALRIAVNGEFENIRALLAAAPGLLKPGGRLAVISFHSLEDRLVKRAIEGDERLRAIGKKPIAPGPDEIQKNPRARSARLRTAERL